MQSAAHYEVPVSEMILLENTDVITSSGWNNDGNGNGNGHWFEEKPGNGNGNTKPGKPGNGGHKN